MVWSGRRHSKPKITIPNCQPRLREAGSCTGREAVVGDATYLKNAPPTTMPFELPEFVDHHVGNDRLGDVA